MDTRLKLLGVLAHPDVESWDSVVRSPSTTPKGLRRTSLLPRAASVGGLGREASAAIRQEEEIASWHPLRASYAQGE
jgi:hypothetical protein